MPSDAFRTCATCRQDSSLQAVVAVTAYEGLAKEIVHSLKFERAGAAAGDIGAVMAARLPQDVEMITYVPTAPARVRARGYDQARLVAKAVAQHASLPCVALLARSGSQRQVGQDRSVRKQQMKDAFRPVNHAAILNRHVLLIDDVLTTGATCEAAAAALQTAGAARVSAAVFAAA